MKNVIDLKLIQIKHITFIINLKQVRTNKFLDFQSEIIKVIEKNSTTKISFEIVNNQFAVLYILPSSSEKSIIKNTIIIIEKIKISCVIIDELFPNNNEFILEKNNYPSEAKWIKNKVFNSTESYIEVI
jgi:hypothetical protein